MVHGDLCFINTSFAMAYSEGEPPLWRGRRFHGDFIEGDAVIVIGFAANSELLCLSRFGWVWVKREHVRWDLTNLSARR